MHLKCNRNRSETKSRHTPRPPVYRWYVLSLARLLSALCLSIGPFVCPEFPSYVPATVQVLTCANNLWTWCATINPFRPGMILYTEHVHPFTLVPICSDPSLRLPHPDLAWREGVNAYCVAAVRYFFFLGAMNFLAIVKIGNSQNALNDLRPRTHVPFTTCNRCLVGSCLPLCECSRIYCPLLWPV